MILTTLTDTNFPSLGSIERNPKWNENKFKKQKKLSLVVFREELLGFEMIITKLTGTVIRNCLW